MNRQFLHKRTNMLNGTLCVDVPYCINYLESGDKISIDIGIAVCHPKDNFNKSIGRNVAAGRMEKRVILCISKEDDTSSFLLVGTGLILCFRGRHLNDIKTANFHI